MPGVRDVRVLAAADPHRGEHVAACIVVGREHRDTITTMAVRQYCSAHLAPYKIPRTVALLDAIPLTARGKTDRRALDELIQAHLNGPAQQLC
jgi:acyl-CoA synthetase (AMP-forming)/AMP-acid ligase II